MRNRKTRSCGEEILGFLHREQDGVFVKGARRHHSTCDWIVRVMFKNAHLAAGIQEIFYPAEHGIAE